MALSPIHSGGPTPIGGGAPAPTGGVNNGGYPSSLDPNSIAQNLQAWLSDPRFTSDPKFREKFFGSMGLDPGERYPGFTAAVRLFPAELANLAQSYGLYSSTLPYQAQLVNQTLGMVANPDKNATQYQAMANAQADSTTNQILQRLRSGGAGIGAKQGAAVAGANQAATSGNQYRAMLSSPQTQLQNASAALGMINSLQPNLQNLQTLTGITTGTPRNQSGLQAVGSALGNFSATIPIHGGGSVTI